MSSEGSVSASSTRLKQFGLYRTIDARTEDFLRLSRKRQIKQGCACAAVSTAITVTIVIVILLIYEYAIAVESSLVQIKRRSKPSNITETNDSPVADRLDRSYFGFDQDYYERMPLLVNAMQENSYVDPTMDLSVEKSDIHQNAPQVRLYTKSKNNLRLTQLRRTSPRPFIFEYKSPTPVPFSKTFGSKSWIDSYRNAQRLENIQNVIKYLEKTINAKMGDMYAEPSQHIAFSGLYVEPGANEKRHLTDPKSSREILFGEDTQNIDIFKSNHKSDPLFKYKPDSPGDVNLLAESFLRFSPTLLGKKEFTNIPMFRPIPTRKKHCYGHSCVSNGHIVDTNVGFGDNRVSESSNYSKAKTFSVMLNLVPLKSHLNHAGSKRETTKAVPPNKIYITTSKPLVIFKRKSATTSKARTVQYKRPRILNEIKPVKPNDQENKNVVETNQGVDPPKQSSADSNMIVQINLYSPDKKNELTTLRNDNFFTTSSTTEGSPFMPISPYTTEIPLNLSSEQVEDYHVGSSGIIPYEARATPPPIPYYPVVSTTIPSFDVTLSNTEGAWYTKAPEILRFSPEDAKIPDEYKHYRTSDYFENFNRDLNRRNSRDKFEMEDFESQTLVTKLRNEAELTTPPMTVEDTYEEEEESTTSATTTTQINGHYRSINRNTKIISTLLDPNSEYNRKRRLNLLAKGFRRPNFSLSYTEITRNKTQTTKNAENK